MLAAVENSEPRGCRSLAEKTRKNYQLSCTSICGSITYLMAKPKVQYLRCSNVTNMSVQTEINLLMTLKTRE